ncbi:hypothetical protein H0H93_010041 [Arthromyces matolae]|nr:hypothetical protein H0H93_010041 [Arthromyces matolae]
MKTIFIQRLVALSIFLASITRTSGTPMPTSLLTARNGLPSFQLVTDNVSLPRNDDDKELGEADATEFDPHHLSRLVARRPGSVMNQISDLISEIEKMSGMEKRDFTHPDEVTTFLKLTLRAYSYLVDKTMSVSERTLAPLQISVFQSIMYSIRHLREALQHRGIPEETGTPLIKLLMEIAKMTMDYIRETSGTDWADYVLGRVNVIMELPLNWKILHDAETGLKKVQSNLTESTKSRGVITRNTPTGE